MTLGGITLGSVAESFHSEDYSREQMEEEERRRAGKGRKREEEFESLLEEEEMEGREADAFEEPLLAARGVERGKVPSAVVEMGDSRSEVADSSNLLRELSMEESRELVRGGARAGEKKKADTGAQSLTLREQEKVRSSDGWEEQELMPTRRSSTSLTRRTSTSSSRSTSTNNVSSASHPTRSTSPSARTSSSKSSSRRSAPSSSGTRSCSSRGIARSRG